MSANYKPSLNIYRFPQRVIAKEPLHSTMFKITVSNTGKVQIEEAAKYQSSDRKNFWIINLRRRLVNLLKKDHKPDYFNINIDKLKEFALKEGANSVIFWFTLGKRREVLYYNGSLKYTNTIPMPERFFRDALKDLDFSGAKTIFMRNFRNNSEYKRLLRDIKTLGQLRKLSIMLEDEETFRNYYL